MGSNRNRNSKGRGRVEEGGEGRMREVNRVYSYTGGLICADTVSANIRLPASNKIIDYYYYYYYFFILYYSFFTKESNKSPFPFLSSSLFFHSVPSFLL